MDSGVHHSNVFANALLALVACVILAVGNPSVQFGGDGTTLPVVTEWGADIENDLLQSGDSTPRFFFIESRTVAAPVVVERLFRDVDRGRAGVRTSSDTEGYPGAIGRPSIAWSVSGGLLPYASLYKLHATYRL